MKKLLIANRGEIAVRIIRAAREMGIRTVAIYSEADAGQLHVALADQAIAIGPPEAAASYLDSAVILGAARESGADAIHPGYGFLSERADFSEACERAGITFVGPSAASMRLLGSKIEAKQLAVSVGVPVTPGFYQPGATRQRLKMAADEIGYPVMLKASAGGGGRGMRIVRETAHFDAEFVIASDEAENAFGDGSMMVEKLIERPRHIEVQVLADGDGGVACLFERECSVQRRHQKLIEEAPAPGLPPGGWETLRGYVQALVKASGYTNAGTVEFMFDPAIGEFYFLEVNARLQVEHPVTEAITGVDLAQWQLRIASGEKLPPLSADRDTIHGYAIEARIVAEDPARGFLPSVGHLLAWAEPKLPGVRVDTGYGPGAEIPRYYDSLLAKVIAHGATREQAINKLEAALLDFHILGVRTNIAYLLEILRHRDFRAGLYDTGFLGREFVDWQPPADLPPEIAQIAALAGTAMESTPELARGVWDSTDSFRVTV
jgi:3-methylcrotonyl-CoA carboxylase alpha subunit